jgi:hypothetical protein
MHFKTDDGFVFHLGIINLELRKAGKGGERGLAGSLFQSS